MNLTEIANKQAEQSSKPEYLATADAEEVTIKGLGIAIAKEFEYSGVRVMEVLKEALEQCNYHEEAAKVQKMIDEI